MTALLCALALALTVLLVRRRSPRWRLHEFRPDADRRPMSRVAVAVSAFMRRRQLRRRREAEVVEAVFALASELRAGRPPARALALVASCTTHLRGELSEAATAVEAGASAPSELRHVAHNQGCAGLGPVAAAWEVTESAGGAIADVLDRLGDVLDVERQNRAALDAALAAPRATMVLLAALPVFGLTLGESLGAHPVGVLLHRPLGWAMLAAAATLDTIGVVWTRTLVHRALR